MSSSGLSFLLPESKCCSKANDQKCHSFEEMKPDLISQKLWGSYLEQLLKSDDSHEFSFSYIRRRVETLNVLSENGEQRHLSLDLNTEILFKLLDKAKDANEQIQKNNNYEDIESNAIKYEKTFPMPFALFSKGILFEFTASAEMQEAQSLSLEEKYTSWAAGYGWLMQSITDEKKQKIKIELLSDIDDAINKNALWNSVLNEVEERVWWICGHKPTDKQMQQISFNESIQNGEIIKQYPDYWLNKGDKSNNSNRVLLSREARILFDKLLYDSDADNPDYDKPSMFYHRLVLLSSSYFPLINIPVTINDIERPVIKFDFLYGESGEQWLSMQTMSLEGMPKSFRVLRFFFPHDAWVYRVRLLSDLEGHCEHLQIRLPPMVELVGGDWRSKLEKKQGKDRKKTIPFSNKDHLRENVVEQHIELDDDDSNNVVDTLRRMSHDTHCKFSRSIISIRRHASVPGTSVRIRFGLLPNMDGVFLPVILILVFLFAVLFGILIAVVYNLSFNISDTLGATLAILPAIVSLALTFLVWRFDTTLRTKMLKTFYRRTAIAVGISSFALLMCCYYLLIRNNAEALVPAVALFAKILVAIAFVDVLYTLIFTTIVRISLWRGRRRLEVKLGQTEQLSTWRYVYSVEHNRKTGRLEVKGGTTISSDSQVSEDV